MLIKYGRVSTIVLGNSIRGKKVPSVVMFGKATSYPVATVIQPWCSIGGVDKVKKIFEEESLVLT